MPWTSFQQGVSDVAKNVLMTKDSTVFRGLNRFVQYGDFVGKAVLYDRRDGIGETQTSPCIAHVVLAACAFPGFQCRISLPTKPSSDDPNVPNSRIDPPEHRQQFLLQIVCHIRRMKPCRRGKCQAIGLHPELGQRVEPRTIGRRILLTQPGLRCRPVRPV